MPVGRARQGDLEDTARTFNAFEGPLIGLRHRDFAGDSVDPDDPTSGGSGFMWVNPIDPNDSSDNTLFTPSAAAGVDAAMFTFVQTSHLGRHLTTPRADVVDGLGLRTRPPTQAEENVCLPATCPGSTSQTAICGVDPAQGSTIELPLRADNDGIVTRELVPDFDFRITSGIVSNATKIVVDDPGVKKLVPGTGFDAHRTAITTIASTEYVEGGVWQRSGDVRFKNDGETVAAALDPFISWPSLNRTPANRAAADADVAALTSQLFSSPTTVPTGADAVATLAGAAGHWALTPTSLPPYAKFPTTTSTLTASFGRFASTHAGASSTNSLPSSLKMVVVLMRARRPTRLK